MVNEMVKKRSRIKRVGGEFADFMEDFRREIGNSVGREVTFTEVSNRLGLWMKHSEIDQEIIRELKRKHGRGGLF